jgi:hypothetical protein
MSTIDELFAYAAIAYEELKCFPKGCSNYLRMDESTYLEVLSIVTPYIKKTRYGHEKSDHTQ